MWYQLCEGEKMYGRRVYNIKLCTSNKLKAMFKLVKYKSKRQDPSMEYWIKKSLEHSDPDFKQFKCPDCNNLMSKRELDYTWDWAGPHCNECGCTGMRMFSSVTLKPIMSGYQGMMLKFEKVLGKKKIREINRKSKNEF